MLLDFTGTDAQMRAAMNLPTYGRPNQWLVLGVVNFLRTSDRALPLNRGILHPVQVKVPEGVVPQPYAVRRDRRAPRDRRIAFRTRCLGALEPGRSGPHPRRRRGAGRRS